MENKFKKSAADEFIFTEHTKLGDNVTEGDEADFEELMLYLRKRSE